MARETSEEVYTEIILNRSQEESFRQSYQRVAKEKNLLNLGPQKALVALLDDVITVLRNVPSPTHQSRRCSTPPSGSLSPTGSPSRGISSMRSFLDQYQGKRSITDLENNLSARSRQRVGSPTGCENPPQVVRDFLGAKGLYIWGPVGQGKTMILDMFCEHAELSFGPSSIVRCHYSDFMLSVYALLHDDNQGTETLSSTASHMTFKEFLQDYLRMSRNSEPQLSQLNNEGTSPRGRKALAQSHSDNRLDILASNIVNQGVRMILLDELQINHISDALIFKRLAEALIQNGVIFIITSNCPPEKLYEGGLNRTQFLPFLKTLAISCPPVVVDTARDLRCWNDDCDNGTTESTDGRQSKDPSYFSPARPERLLRKVLMKTEVGFRSNANEDTTVEVFHGRKLPLLLYHKDCQIGLASFEHLCRYPCAQSDYIGLSRLVQRKLYVSGIPQLNILRDSEACRRFMNLIDIFTDRDISLHIEAAVPPLKLITGITRIVDNFDAFCMILLKNFKSWDDFSSKYRTLGTTMQLTEQDWRAITLNFLPNEDSKALWKGMTNKSGGVSASDVLTDENLKSAICFHIVYGLANAKHYKGNIPPNDNNLASRMLRFVFGDSSLASFMQAALEAGRENGGYSLDKRYGMRIEVKNGVFQPRV